MTMAAHLNDDDRQPPTPTPPLDNDDLDAIVDSNRHLAPDGKAYTQLGHAERLAEAHGKHIRFVPIWGRWLHYSDGRWHLDYRESTALPISLPDGNLGQPTVIMRRPLAATRRRTSHDMWVAVGARSVPASGVRVRCHRSEAPYCATRQSVETGAI